ncbi:transposase [Candidatus Tisiphia endosymbiont of Nemotelus uliginosus]|uniref:transposase n=1 Tax=unclassified Candidatus Tisiphia TaxID=2996318 RepID=UPI0035CA9F93
MSNLSGKPEDLYDKIYCMRGDMENRIKEQQLELFADRTSCHKWSANQLKLILSSLAYTLVEYIRDKFLQGTELAKAQVGTIRLKLFKIGAVIIRNSRRIKFLLSSSYPYQHIWNNILQVLALE